MEITYQNTQQDFDAYYAWYAKETKRGKKQSWMTFILLQVWIIVIIISMTNIISWISGSENNSFICLGFLFLLGEMVSLLMIKFRISSYVIQSFKKAEDSLTKKQRENSLSQRTNRFNDLGLEISNLFSIHCYNWQLIDEIVVKNSIIIILSGSQPVLVIPRRSFDSEESYNDFSNKLIDLNNSHNDPPISQTRTAV